MTTSRIRLTPLKPSDAAELRRITDDPVIIDAISFLKAPFTLADARALIVGTGNDLFFGIWSTDTNELIGVVGSHLVGGDEIEIGYWIATPFAGQGYASEAARGVIDVVGGIYPERSIFAECRPENLASWRVLEKLGFRPTDEDGQRAGRKKLVLS